MQYSGDSTNSTAAWRPDDSSYICPTDDGIREKTKLWRKLLKSEIKEWRKYLKALWLKALNSKRYFNAVQFLKGVLYYRRLLFSISGWLARNGHNKKN